MAHALPPHAERTTEAIVTNCLRQAANKLSIRRALAIALGLHGLRGQEVCNLNRSDLDAGRRLLRVKTIKRGRTRILELDPLITRQLVDANRGATRDSPLLVGPARGRLNRRSMFRYGSWLADVLDVRCSFHSLRHTAAHRVYRHTHDVYAVHKMLGHKTLHQTHVYLQSTMPVQVELGPTFGGWLGQADLVAYPGPMNDEQRATALRQRLVEGRVPPPRGNDARSNARAKTNYVLRTTEKRLAGLDPLEREHVLRQLISTEWPMHDPPPAEKSSGNKSRHSPPKT